jgi:hypothetical protein
MTSPPERKKMVRRRLAVKGGDKGELKIKTNPQKFREVTTAVVRGLLINLGEDNPL